MPPTPVALLVVALISCVWAAVIVSSGYIVAAAGLVGFAICCAALGLVKRKRAARNQQ